MSKSTAEDAGDGLDDETFERVAEDARRMPDRESKPRHRGKSRIGEDEGGEPPERRGVDRDRDGELGDPAPRRHEPSARLDDPRVPLVPESTADPGESEAQAAARLGEDRRQDDWGEPEDAPDHDGNEAYEQQRAPRER